MEGGGAKLGQTAEEGPTTPLVYFTSKRGQKEPNSKGAKLQIGANSEKRARGGGANGSGRCQQHGWGGVICICEYNGWNRLPMWPTGRVQRGDANLANRQDDGITQSRIGEYKGEGQLPQRPTWYKKEGQLGNTKREANSVNTKASSQNTKKEMDWLWGGQLSGGRNQILFLFRFFLAARSDCFLLFWKLVYGWNFKKRNSLRQCANPHAVFFFQFEKWPILTSGWRMNPLVWLRGGDNELGLEKHLK